MIYQTNTTQTHRPLPLSLASRNSRQQTFSAGVQRYGQLFTLAQQGYLDLGSAADNAPVYLPPALLDTHLMIQAPTGHGKTFLARIIFRELAKNKKRAAILVDDPKHDFLEALEEDCAGLRLDDRVTIADTSDPSRTPLFNPLKKNGIRIEDQTQWLLCAIRACFNQDNFDQTPQRPRWMYNSLLPVIEGEGTFDDVLTMLDYNEVGIRHTFIARTSNARVRKEWLAYEEQSMTRRRDETSSSFAWLRKFCLNETLRHIFTPSPFSFDFGRFLRNAGILLQSFPRYRPLDEDSVNFLRSLSLHSLLAQAFHIPLGQRPPLYLILDEAEHALERDTGLIETILNEGRSLGIHLCLLFHDFSQVAKSRPALLESVLTNCRTKIIGGHLTQANLDILTSELFVNEWHPHIIRDQITSLEVEPCETTRVVRTITRTQSKERGMSYPFVETEGQSAGHSQGTQETRGTFHGHTTGKSVADGQTLSSTTGRSHTASLGTSDTHMEGYSHQSGQGHGHGTMDASGTGRMRAEGEGTSMSWDPYSPAAIMPNAMTTAEHETTGMSSHAVHAESAHEQSFTSEGWNNADASTISSTESDTTSEAETSGTSHVEGTSQAESVGETFAYGTTTNQSEQRSTSTTTGENYSVSRGNTPSESTSEGESIAESITPFHELKKRWRVASREFLSLADFLTTKLIQLKSQPKMHWAIQPPEGKTVFFKARFVKPLAGGRERLSAFRNRVFSKPWYHGCAEDTMEPRAATTEAIQVADAAHLLTLTTRLRSAMPRPTPGDESNEEDFDDWSTEKPTL